MTSYPKNEQFTNLKVNSEQDLFEINPIIPTDNDAILNAICNNECLPQDKFGNLLPPCNNLLAALKVNGSAIICKGLNIGNTNEEFAGTIRWNGEHFEGFNGEEWVLLDCCIKEIDVKKVSVCGNDHVEIIPINMDDSISIGPKPDGKGFLSAQLPTPGSNIGGNCRGFNAVDWQMKRNLASQVAGATGSFIGNGQSNEINNLSDKSGIVVGEGNKIENLNSSSNNENNIIGAGYENYLFNSSNSGIFTGNENRC